MAYFRALLCLVAAVAAIPAPAPQADSTSSAAAAACTGNTAADRSVWCDHSIDTNWYDEVPDTGVIVEV